MHNLLLTVVYLPNFEKHKNIYCFPKNYLIIIKTVNIAKSNR